MSSGAVRRVSRQDIQLVQNLIERCLQLYMNQKEVVYTLLDQAKIDPGFTELVWQKLEEENREFFKAYYLRLMVKQQIMEFNKLLDQQFQLMQQMQSSGASALPTSNGTHMPTLPQNPACYATGPALSAENIQGPIASGLPNAFTNGGPPLPSSLHTAMHMPAHASRIDAPPTMLSSQTSNMGGLVPGINGGLIKTEAGYSGASPYMFGSDHNVLETRPPIGDASVASFSSVDSTSQPIGEPLLDGDSSSFGFLGQIPRNFSLSDLTADFSQSSGLSDILESYPRSPFLATDAENFLDSRERVEQGDTRRLDPISESLNYGDFGSD